MTNKRRDFARYGGSADAVYYVLATQCAELMQLFPRYDGRTADRDLDLRRI